MNLSLISKFRTELMGLAMLMVVWHHIPISFNSSIYNFFKSNGGFGVDIFLLLSGLGLFFSNYNKLIIKEYIKKRIIRIFPIYALIIIIVSFIKGENNPIDILLKITTIGWWIGCGAYDWFIPNLIVLYFLYPFFHLLLKKKNCLYISIGIIVIFYFFILFLPYGSPFQSLYRYPVFFLGAIIGKLIKDYTNNNILNIFFIILLLIGCSLSIYVYIKYYESNLNPNILTEIKNNGWLFTPYLFIVTGFCMIISYILNLLRSNYIQNLLTFIGSMSIEIYLLHGQFISLTRYLTDTYGYNKSVIGFILILFSFFISYLVHLLNIKIMDTLKSKVLK